MHLAFAAPHPAVANAKANRKPNGTFAAVSATASSLIPTESARVGHSAALVVLTDSESQSDSYSDGDGEDKSDGIGSAPKDPHFDDKDKDEKNKDD